MDKMKKISKYALNILTIVNALLTALGPIWDIPNNDKIIGTVSAIMAIMATYLLGDKAISSRKNSSTEALIEICNEATEDEYK